MINISQKLAVHIQNTHFDEVPNFPMLLPSTSKSPRVSHCKGVWRKHWPPRREVVGAVPRGPVAASRPSMKRIVANPSGMSNANIAFLWRGKKRAGHLCLTWQQAICFTASSSSFGLSDFLLKGGIFLFDIGFAGCIDSRLIRPAWATACPRETWDGPIRYIPR